MTAERVKPVFEDGSASAELREFVELARRDGPSAAELQQLATRVGAALGMAVAASSQVSELGSGPEQVPAGVDYAVATLGRGTFGKLLTSSSAKLVAGLGLLASLGLGFVSQLRTATVEHASTTSVRASTHAPRVDPALPPSRVPEPTPRVESLEAQAAPLPTPAVVRKKSKAPIQRAPETAPSVPVAAPSVPVPSELTLIRGAESARGEPSRALRLLEEHARFYPQGALVQEREVLAIEALLRAGQVVDGRARAARFVREHGDSAHLPRLQALLARARGE